MFKRPYAYAKIEGNGNVDAHAEQLKRGLARLPHMIAHICPLCEGRGEREQNYIVGCGGGMCRMTGVCDWCDGSGLLQNDNAAPNSVVNQVLVAGEQK